MFLTRTAIFDTKVNQFFEILIYFQINEENGAPRPVMRVPRPGLLPAPSTGEASTAGDWTGEGGVVT